MNMPKVNVTKFLGYTSKPGMINRPGLATDCGYIIINKGELVNHPGFKGQRSLSSDQNDFSRLNILHSLYNVYGKEYQIAHWYGRIRSFILAEIDFIVGELFHFFEDINAFWPLGFDPNYQDIQYGNWVQAGDSMLLLALASDPNTMIIEEPSQSHPERLPRMFRFTLRPEIDVLNGVSQTLIGIKPPKKVTISGSLGTGGNLIGEYQFAISFCTNIQNEPGLTQKTLGLHNLESIAIIDPTTYDFTGGFDEITFKVYLPEGYNELEPLGLQVIGGKRPRLGIYVRDDPQDNFFFVHYQDNQGIILNDSDGNYFEVNIKGSNVDDPLGGTQSEDLATTGVTSTTITAPHFDRDVPNPSNHGAVFRNRMYYAVANTDANTWELNHLEFSQLMESAGVEASYIEASIPIGGDSVITGLIEFLGQLIIFKQNETYVLTGDRLIGQGQVRQLFNNNGCVNIDGGHAYLVINNVLYFLDSDGLYAWNGQGDPIEISKLIQEDLEAIPRERYKYARLSHDRRYKLLYLTFPHSPESNGMKETAYIFHYAEGGAWTRFEPRDKDVNVHQFLTILNTNLSKRLLITTTNIIELGLIQDLLNSPPNVDALWLSGRLDMQVPGRQKHWKFLNVGLQELDETVLYIEIENDDILVTNDSNGKVRISRFLNELSLKFKFKPVTSLTPVFRISGYTLDVNLRGRR